MIRTYYIGEIVFPKNTRLSGLSPGDECKVVGWDTSTTVEERVEVIPPKSYKRATTSDGTIYLYASDLEPAYVTRTKLWKVLA
jgi:hypothetical protein